MRFVLNIASISSILVYRKMRFLVQPSLCANMARLEWNAPGGIFVGTLSIRMVCSSWFAMSRISIHARKYSASWNTQWSMMSRSILTHPLLLLLPMTASQDLKYLLAGLVLGTEPELDTVSS